MMRHNAFNIRLCPVWSSVENKGDGKMYGLLLESVQYYIIQDVGEPMWNKILEHAGYKNLVFTTHSTYKDEIITRLAESCCHVTKSQKDFNQWMTFFGTCFVEFCTSYGYDKLLRVSGRHYRDFLHGIDNIHEVIRFSYPRLQSPAFLVLTEDSEGCVLLYQSKRRGFKFYVIGQLQQIARRFYDVSVNITVIEEELIDRKCHVRFRLDFDNSAYKPKPMHKVVSGKTKFSNISSDTFLKVFPFCIVFNTQLVIRMVGSSMMALLKEDNLIGSPLGDKFNIRRPLIPCVWSKILQFRRVIFELEYLFDSSATEDHDAELISDSSQDSGTDPRVLLRGQMKYLDDWNMIAFLCTPLLNDLKDLRKAGLFINDLNSFDMSRDMVMAGWQHASQLERSIEEQRYNSEKITDNMTKFEEWKQKSDNLLYTMIPKSVASKLKSGQDPVSTCEVFDNVTIMFNYMEGFGDVCSAASPMEIVKIINTVFSVFDHITDKYNVFKVETLGDAVYMVAGGVPDRNPDNALSVAGLALELRANAKTLTEPWNKEYKLNTRIGMHTGSVVGGVVGRRMPQYCLFGDTVNTASRMQTYSQPGRIHISEPCQECLKGSQFVTILRGTVNVKGKGEMRTFWLAGREGEEQTNLLREEIKAERNQTVRKYSSCENAMDLHAMHASTSFAQMPANFGGLKSNRSTSSISLSRLQQEDEISKEQLSPGNRTPMRLESPLSSCVKLRGKVPDNASESQAKVSIFEESPIDIENEIDHSRDAKEAIRKPYSAENLEDYIPDKKGSKEPVPSNVTESQNIKEEKQHYGLKLGKFKLNLPKLSQLPMFSYTHQKSNKQESLNGYTVKDQNTETLNESFEVVGHDVSAEVNLRPKVKLFIGSDDDLKNMPFSKSSTNDNSDYDLNEEMTEEVTVDTNKVFLSDNSKIPSKEDNPPLRLNVVSNKSEREGKCVELTKVSSTSAQKTTEIRNVLDQLKQDRKREISHNAYFSANNYMSQEIECVREKSSLFSNCERTLQSLYLNEPTARASNSSVDTIAASEKRRGECSVNEKQQLEKICPNALRQSFSDRNIVQSKDQNMRTCISHQGFDDTEVRQSTNSNTRMNDICRDNIVQYNTSNNNFTLPTKQSCATTQVITPVIEMDKLKVLERGIKLAWGLEKRDGINELNTHSPTTDINESNTGDTNALLNGQTELTDNSAAIQSHSKVVFQLSDDES